MKPYTYRAAGEPDDQAGSLRSCPLCGAALTRIARTTTDRVLSLVLVAHRFRCESFHCRWEGTLRPASAANAAPAAPAAGHRHAA